MPAYQITYTSDAVLNVRKEDMQRAGREAMLLVGRLQHRANVPRKFRKSAIERYKLAPRGYRYTKAKLARAWAGKKGLSARAIGNPAPFVWSGRTRQRVLANKKVVARAPSAERAYCDVILDAPVLNFKGGGTIDLREEMQRVTDEELAQLQAVAVEKYDRVIRRHGRPRTRRIK